MGVSGIIVIDHLLDLDGVVTVMGEIFVCVVGLLIFVG